MKNNENKPIRVAQVIGKWVGGGVEAVVMNYYRHIDHDKIQFDFICDDDSTDIPYEEIESFGGKVILIPPYQKIFKYQKELRKVLKQGNYKIVHSHINTLSVFPLYAAKKVGVPVRIAHSHSTTNKKEWKKNLLKVTLRLFAKLYATDYFACTEHAGRWLFGDKEFDKGNVYILNNAIDVDKFKYNEEVRKQKRAQLGIGDDTLVIGHIGRFVEQKNHRFLIDVFNEVHKQNENSKLILIGQGPLEDEIRRKVKDLNIDDSVLFLGQRTDTNEWYQVFDVFLFPSLYEGLGMALIEAQCSGCYCICSCDVPKIAKVSTILDFMPLAKNLKEWTEKILGIEVTRINAGKTKIDECGYNIQIEVKNLEKKYKEGNKIKICHVVCGLKAGGVEAMIKNYCSKLNSEKYEWHLLYQHDPIEKDIEELKKIGFKLKRIASKVKNPIKNYLDIYEYLKKNHIDVVHCHMTIMNCIPLIAAKKLKIKIRISHSHNNDVREKKGIVKIIEKTLKKACINNATKLLACGEDAGKYLYGNNEFEIINNAMDLKKFKFDERSRKKIRKMYNIKEDEILIGHIGRFSKQKNHIFIIEIFKRIIENSKFKLMLIGDGELKEEILKLAQKYNLQNKIVFTGIIENIYEYYSAFDVFILPSIWEGLPVVSIEAQISGLSCILSENIDKKCKINYNVIFLNGDINNWEKTIKNLDVYNRNIDEKIFNDKGMNIEIEVKKIDKIYSEDI